ncbi:MAG: 2-succinyl-6-hydroxy-2,4-cyclohexadiene-1-carboxylate synthase [Aeromonas sp.]
MLKAPPVLVFLHGFLGDRHDWQRVITKLPDCTCVALDLPGHGANSARAVDDFAGAEAWLRAEIAARGLTHYRLVGYSLGGRLALYHASLQPKGLSGVLVENSHFGLSAAARPARRVHDAAWAARFAHEPLAAVLAAWYQQGVFSDLSPATRTALIAKRCRNNNGAALAQMLNATSLGAQPKLSAALSARTFPLWYVSGARDEKFHQLACQWAQADGKIHHITLAGGHNLHLPLAADVAAVIRSWLRPD